jgi:hypothetical protein
VSVFQKRKEESPRAKKPRIFKPVTDEILIHARAASDRIDLWQRILCSCRVGCMAEVGVWRGAYSSAMLRDCPGISTYYLIDPWRKLADWNKPLNVSPDKFNDAYSEAMAAVAFAGSRVVVLRGTTLEVSDQIPDGSLDAVYIDGDHTLRGITIDLIRLLPKLRPDGLLCGDDYVADPWHQGSGYEPTLVAPFASYFAEAFELPIVALPFNQFVIYNRPGKFLFTNASGRNHSRQVGMAGRFWSRKGRDISQCIRGFLSRRSEGRRSSRAQ